MSGIAVPTEYRTGYDGFLSWARQELRALRTVSAAQSLIDLRPLGEMIGDARIVALGEAVHGVCEPLELRNRLLKYLVTEMDFTAIAIESGLVEGQRVHEYVRGGPGSLREVMTTGFGWNFGELVQNEALVTWLRQINADPARVRKVSFYGFDIPGSPGDSSATCGPEVALMEALKYLDRVDPRAGAGFRGRLRGFLPRLRFDYHARLPGPGYHVLDAAERDTLTGAIADLTCLIERNEKPYIDASSFAEYDWAKRVGVGACQIDSWLRHVPHGWRATREQVQRLDRASDVRDRAQAENIEWIVKREGPDGKVLLFAHNFHLSGQPAARSSWPLQAQSDRSDDAATVRHEVAGTYLRRRYGSQLVSIANLIGDPTLGPIRSPVPVALGSDEESFDTLFSSVGVPQFVLDLRRAPRAVARLLQEERQLGGQFDLPDGYRGCIQLALGQAFDIALYMDSALPVQPVSTRAD